MERCSFIVFAEGEQMERFEVTVCTESEQMDRCGDIALFEMTVNRCRDVMILHCVN
jgi:hypothetical protein